MTRTLRTSAGLICIEEASGLAVTCQLPELPEKPNEPLQIYETGTTAACRFIARLLTGPSPGQPPFRFPPGTPFQRAVWQALCNVPCGETRSYRQIAEAIGRPRAARAVGNACRANLLPLFIPCHRAVNSNGKPGGFSAGTGWKTLLLHLEQSGGNPTIKLSGKQNPPYRSP